MTLGRVAAVVFAVSACVDPVTPSAGVPTLDDVGSDGFVAVAVGQAHSCALKSDGSAYCWGSNEFGQLGIAPSATVCQRADQSVPCQATPRPVLGGLKYTRITAGTNHTCALALDSRVLCWGDNLRGQIGDPAVRVAVVPTPVVSAGLFVDVAAGDEHNCAVRSDNVVMCWGSNEYGQLGLSGVGTGSAIPVATPTPLRFASVAAGADRTCARLVDGTAYCWGASWLSRASDGTEVILSQTTPTRVAITPAFQVLAVGGGTTCGLAVDGTAQCWQANPTGAMGDASTEGSQTPKPVATSERFVALGVGASHTCAVSDVGVVWCWGSDASGQLGISSSRIGRRCGTSSSIPCVLSPTAVSGWRLFSSVSLGLGEHVCGITLASNVYCWGAGSMGQLGVGSERSNWSPTKIIAP